jgi:hypothetical protein
VFAGPVQFFLYFQIRQPVAVASCLIWKVKTGLDRTCKHYWLLSRFWLLCFCFCFILVTLFVSISALYWLYKFRKCLKKQAVAVEIKSRCLLAKGDQKMETEKCRVKSLCCHQMGPCTLASCGVA